MEDAPNNLSRRRFLGLGARLAAAGAAAGAALALLTRRARPADAVWQLDPNKCIRCGNCATACVLGPSAVKCVHAFAMCGYCEICKGYSPPNRPMSGNAEDRLCPTDAIRRTFVEDPYYEYTIDEGRCIGCGKCVEGCTLKGNGSLFLQVRHDRCVNCNQCRIAASCPAGAYRRVPADEPYLLKDRPQNKEQRS